MKHRKLPYGNTGRSPQRLPLMPRTSLPPTTRARTAWSASQASRALCRIQADTARPRRFRHRFGHTWLDRDDPEGDPMELNGWSSPQMLRRYGASARNAGPPHLRPHMVGQH